MLGNSLRSLSGHAVAAGLLAAFVGFASSFAVIVQGLTAMGATPAQATSGLVALSVAMGLCGIVVGLQTKMPISIAWSTPGAALLAQAGMPQGGWPVAVGAFLACGALIVLAGLWRPLGRWVAAIPAPLASAMLAGVILPLCLAPLRAVQAAPAIGLPVIAAWLIVAQFRRLFAVPAAVAVAGVLAVLHARPGGFSHAMLWPHPLLTMPQFRPAALVGVAVPLFIVTMASQNIPGLAVLAAYGYRPPLGALFRATGLATLIAAPFGGHAINLAAITAALCAGEDAGPDPGRRYWAGVVASAAYAVLGLLSGLATALIAAAPPFLIQAVAGLALLGALGSALRGMAADPRLREPAVLCFLTTASGISVWGIGGAFWGLLAGGAAMAAAGAARRLRARRLRARRLRGAAAPAR
jgi:benzoate membrane transport protein